MQIRCYNCRTPINLNRDLVHAALDEMLAQNHNHHNVNCPRCRKVNRVSKKQLRRWAPNWKPAEQGEAKETE